MTHIAWWEDSRAGQTMQVNHCLTTTITQHQAYKCDDYPTLVRQRLAPMIWLAMPVHDPPAAA